MLQLGKAILAACGVCMLGALGAVEPFDSSDVPADGGGTLGTPRWWGNACYLPMDVGDQLSFGGRTVRLEAIDRHLTMVSINGTTVELVTARRGMPQVVEGVRVFASDSRHIDALTTDTFIAPKTHAALAGHDAMICLSDAAIPLLDPERFTFPISSEDGYVWSMEEKSQQWQYYATNRAHEGIDLDATGAKRSDIHPLVAIENAIVHYVSTGNNGAIILQSVAEPGIYYTYKHTRNPEVSIGQTVTRGQRLAYVYGDGTWDHLHFAVLGYGPEPTNSSRYDYELNPFPMLVGLAGKPKEKIWSEGLFKFEDKKQQNAGRRMGDAFSPLTGWGWRLDFAAVQYLEHNNPNGVKMRKTLHQGTAAEATNLDDFYDFDVRVTNGRYQVRAEVGQGGSATWQRVEFQGIDAGIYNNSRASYTWTPWTTVTVSDGLLTMRLHLKDDNTYAGLRKFEFKVASGDNRGPEITVGPAVTDDPVTGTTAVCTVTATDPDADDLSYVWSATGPESVAFAPQAASTTATFSKAGTYIITVTVTDGRGGSTNAETTVTVVQTADQLLIMP